MSEIAFQTGAMQGEQRKKRVLTDARKAQNRLAQRAFRQRQREAAKALQAPKKIPHRLHELRPRQPRQSGEVGEQPEVLGATRDYLQSTEAPQTGIGLDQEQVELQRDPLISESLTWSEVPTENLNPDEVYEATLSTARFIADVDTTIVRSSFVGPMGVPFVDFGDCSDLEVGPGSSEGNCVSASMIYDDPAIVLEPIAQSIPTSSFEHEETQSTLLGDISTIARDDTLARYHELPAAHLHPMTLSTVEHPIQNYSLPQDRNPQNSLPQDTTPEINPSHQQRQLAILTLWHSSSPSQTYRTPTIPSPYLNLLTPYQTGIISAFIHNALALSIAHHELLTNAPLSPFYRPTSTSTSASTLLSSIPSHYPPHLRPTLPQVLFRHHAYLDLLPFPMLRERGIAWASTTPPLFDPRELKMDIVMGGLVCKTDGDGGGGGGGQPWDVRSWTVAGWFRVKWRLLLN